MMFAINYRQSSAQQVQSPAPNIPVLLMHAPWGSIKMHQISVSYCVSILSTVV